VPAESKAWLMTTAAQMKKLPSGSVIEISGHTDNVGEEAANVQLSQERANSVRQFLIDQGVDANALTTAGYGSSKPVANNDSFDGRFKNRRIEFTVKTS
jgi:OOP family OmpA-OmpF porin